MSIPLATVKANVRSKINDNATSHLVRGELPQGLINSSNKIYVLNYYPVVDKASMIVIVDGAVILASAFSADLTKGRITLTTAPTTSILVDYYFWAFTDTDIEIWIANGINLCGMPNLTSVPDIMITAVEYFAVHFGCNAWARKYAEGFSWTVGPETVDKNQISQNYMALAKENYDKGILTRDDFYKRFGQREAPSADIRQWFIPRYDVLR